MLIFKSFVLGWIIESLTNIPHLLIFISHLIIVCLIYNLQESEKSAKKRAVAAGLGGETTDEDLQAQEEVYL